MKQETKNEMDLLLRRLGRRDEPSVSNAAGEHLDADELSAYAENALPAVARTRYTAHLAECSHCRDILVQLSSSVGVVSATESVKVSAPSVWSRFLASLFTPMVLRYAAPALGLIVVAVIGFVVLRRDQSSQYVTQVTSNEQRPVPLPSAEPTASYADSETKAVPAREERADQQKRKSETDIPPSPPNAPPSVSRIETEVSKDAAAQPKPEQQPASGNEARPAKAPVAPAPEERPRAAEPEVSKKEVKELPAAARSAERLLQAEQRDDSRTRGFVRDKADEVGPASVRSVSKQKRDELNVSASSRTVAGHRFTKKGGVWIDSAYDSSKESTTLTRGSEQYRALIGDEPEIKTIADELDGEIIVVWKGRTYRIR
jgi:hypothetical protein